MILTLLTPHRLLLTQEKADEIFLPGYKGQLNLFDNHANYVTPLDPGVVRWRVGTLWKSAVVSYGILEVLGDQFTVLADVSELETEVDKERAKAAGEKARKKIEEGGLDDENFRKHELKLKRAMARLSV